MGNCVYIYKWFWHTLDCDIVIASKSTIMYQDVDLLLKLVR